MINQRLVTQINNALSKEPRIKLAYILGSAVSGRAREGSDFDLAVVVDDEGEAGYKKIYSLVADIQFPGDLDLSVVDGSCSPLFLFEIISTGSCVYRKSEEIKTFFEAFVLKNYYDNAHIRKIYHSYLKDKFPYANK